jgi:hypothetical protein
MYVNCQQKHQIILHRTNETKTLIKDLRKRKSHFCGHIIRKEQIEHTVITGKIYGKRDNERRFRMIWQFG